ncbi:hypothetical protein J437_LFUL015341 [Ladona fulva]|uniref:Eukaryotic translation initiation factor 3 subunit J n=1 Tax=Ladona fulva TaxID=123851 RepID=A0A8K0KHL5_LADFU|nr:hypothetical protein J437_LFUL015341 [Ladona fulva]
MDDEWDKDNFDPEPKIPAVVDRWEGEDEDDDVKESWEDEEDEEKEEKKDVEKQDDDVATKAVQVKKSKKSLSEKIEEKERLAKAELEQKLNAKKDQVLDHDDDDEDENDEEKELTPEEKYALKVQQQKLQEEADLRVAMETFGVKEVSGTGLEGTPSTQEEFNDYQSLLIAKIDSLSKSAHFPNFGEEIVRNICLQLPLVSLKKVKSSVEVISQEKLKLEKGDKKKKGKGKAQLRLEGNVNLLNEYSAYKDLEDYDDFM